MFHRTRVLISGLCLVALLVSASGPALAQPPAPIGDDSVAKLIVGPDGLTWQMLVNYDAVVLTVTGPDGQVLRREFKTGQTPVFNLKDAKGRIADGQYTYELQVTPVLDAQTRAALAAARQSGDEAAVIAKLQQSGQLPKQPQVQSGSFIITQGQVMVISETEPQAARSATAEVQPQEQIPNAPNDYVINDDLIVIGSECLGIDCVNGESFGFDTLRLKENNTRIKFDDTSTSTGFPNHDWQLTANDSASGGANKFSIEDVSAGTVPFTLVGSAPSNSLFVSSAGRVGLGTSTPVLQLHLVKGDTPATRLEQNGSSGFSPQTWDIAGNETNFFIRDVTNGSRLPFRIRPGAPTSSIDIAASGNVGIGTASPVGQFEVKNTSANKRSIWALSSDGGRLGGIFEEGDTRASMSIFNAADVQTVRFDTGGNSYINGGSVGIGTTTPADLLQVAGDVRVGTGTTGCVKDADGTVIAGTCSSDLRMKKDVVPFANMLDKVTQLVPVYFQWNATEFPQYHFNGNAQSFGLIAQDVEKVLPEMVTTDANGYKAVKYNELPLVLLRALIDLRTEKDAQIKDLQQQNAALLAQNVELARRLSALEDKVNALSSKP